MEAKLLYNVNKKMYKIWTKLEIIEKSMGSKLLKEGISLTPKRSKNKDTAKKHLLD